MLRAMLHRLTVPAAAADTRLDVWLEGALDGCSRSLVARLIRDGRCLVEPGKPKPGYFLRGGEAVSIEVPEVEPSDAVAEDIPLSVLHEDAAIIVVDKPAGMVVHPAIGHHRGTLVNALLGRYGAGGLGGTAAASGGQPGGDAWRPGIVHRLDQDTSGVIVVARTPAALVFLQGAFKQRTVRKRYLAAVHGALRADFLENAGWIGRHPKDFRKRAVLAEGAGDAKEAYTSVRVLARCDGYCLVEARPRTGRTHQVRVHLADLGHPVLADAVYGRSAQWPLSPTPGQAVLRRQALHAWAIEIPHPDGGLVRFQASPPADLAPLVPPVPPGPRLEPGW